MKTVSITGERRAELIEVPIPEVSREHALVRVTVAPMCTEYKKFMLGSNSSHLGHEAVGEVVEIGSPGNVRVGDRVVTMPLSGCGECAMCLAGDYIHCLQNPMQDATLAQYVVKPSFQLRKIPDDISDEQAALACCALGPSFGAFQRMSLGAFDTVLITGLGPVGLGAVVNAKFRGAQVIALDTNEFRCNLAKELGADLVLDPRPPQIADDIRSACSGIGPDYAIDCSGSVAAHRTCIDAVRRKGAVALVGECSEETPIGASRDFIRKGITLFGAWHYNLNDFSKVMHVIRNSPAVNRLVTHVLPMSRIQEAFEVSSAQQCAKIFVKPWE